MSALDAGLTVGRLWASAFAVILLCLASGCLEVFKDFRPEIASIWCTRSAENQRVSERWNRKVSASESVPLQDIVGSELHFGAQSRHHLTTTASMVRRNRLEVRRKPANVPRLRPRSAFPSLARCPCSSLSARRSRVRHLRAETRRSTKGRAPSQQKVLNGEFEPRCRLDTFVLCSRPSIFANARKCK